MVLLFSDFFLSSNLVLIFSLFLSGNCHIPGEDESWDFGTGAGFYVDATQKPWSEHYRMYSYVTSELPEVIEKHFPVNVERQSIMGHR